MLRFAPEDAEAFEVLVKILRAPDEPTSSRAFWALSFLVGRHGEKAIPCLEKILRREQGLVRLGALGVLGYASFGHPRLAPALVPLLSDRDPETAQAALAALALCGPLDALAVAEVRKRLASPDVKTRAGAALVLGMAGPAGRAALADLRKGIDAEDAAVRLESALAVARLDPEGARTVLPALVDGFRGEDRREWPSLAKALGAMGPMAAPAVGSLLDALRTAEPDDARAIREALEAILPAR